LGPGPVLRTYLDSSVLVSLYSKDANSDMAIRIMDATGGELVVSSFAELEMVNALELRVFRKEISSAEAAASVAIFRKNASVGAFQIRRLPEGVFERALQLARQTTARLGTRTADLFHVAAALEMRADHLCSFDRQQRKLAHSVGLKLNRIAAI
jgi:predicted nucleic acid-binding protein